jgi:hypothetical protein
MKTIQFVPAGEHNFIHLRVELERPFLGEPWLLFLGTNEQIDPRLQGASKIGWCQAPADSAPKCESTATSKTCEVQRAQDYQILSLFLCMDFIILYIIKQYIKDFLGIFDGDPQPTDTI